ncbi:MAG: NTP transferase domain-containing protein [bacterium]
MRICGIIISAGLSERMGTDKALLNYNGIPFVIQIILNLSKVCEKIIVVTRHNSEKIKISIEEFFLSHNLLNNETISQFRHAELKDAKEKVKVIFNPDYETGMFTSLQKGIGEALNYDWTIYHFVDQPMLQENFYSDLISQTDETYDWIQPEYKGKKGHPIVFRKSIYDMILNSPQESSLKEISNNEIIKKKLWDCGYPEVLNDIDTPDIYYELTNGRTWI